MESYEHRKLQEMLGMSSNEDVLERILEILEEEQHRKIETTRAESRIAMSHVSFKEGLNAQHS